MPQVPVYSNFQTQISDQPTTPLQAPEDLGIAGKQQQQLGQALESAGQQANTIYTDMQRQANQLRVDDAKNKLEEAAMKLRYDKDVGFANITGNAALQRESGMPLADEYADKLKTQADSIASTLGNDVQRQAFMKQASGSLSQFHGQVMSHEAQQFKDYTLSVREGTIALQTDKIGLNYNNPDVIKSSLASIDAAVYDQAQLQGKSAVWAGAHAQQLKSNALKGAIGAALEKNDLTYASSLLDAHKGDMSAEDILSVQGKVTKQIVAQTAYTTASEVIQGVAPRMNTSDGDRAFNIAMGPAFDIAVGKESRWNQFDKNGAPLTSKKGAIGIAQVLTSTGPEAAKLAGLPWDANRFRTDKDYNYTLGRAYFAQKVKEFGNLEQAYAAYNAGAGATRIAIVKAAKDGSNWLSKMPAETQDYVSTNMAKYNSGGGTFSKPTEIDVIQAVKQKIGTSNPALLKATTDEALQQFNIQQKAVKEQGDAYTASAMRAIEQNGGRYSELPASVRNNIPANDVSKVMEFGQRVSKGDDTTSLPIYQRLETDPVYLKKMTDHEFQTLRSELSVADFKHFTDKRALLLTGKNTSQDIDFKVVSSTLNNRLITLNIDPDPKNTNKDGTVSEQVSRIGAIRKFVNESITNAQVTSGKKLTDAEIQAHIDGLFVKSQAFRYSVLGMTTSRSLEQLLTMKTDDIPDDVLKNLKVDFSNKGIKNPSSADLLGAYWHFKFSNNPRGKTATGTW